MNQTSLRKKANMYMQKYMLATCNRPFKIYLTRAGKPFILFILLLFGGQTVMAQKAISGTVTDASNGSPLPGATIVEKGTYKGTVSDINGSFELQVTSDNVTLTVSFVGYIPANYKLAGETNVNIVLEPDILNLEEVVVVGYGTQKKSVVTGAIARVDNEMLEKSRSTRIEQALQGQTAGVVIVNNSGQPGDNLTVRIRGVGTVKNSDPLYIVDGMPLEQSSLDFLNPSDVQSVEVLKDAASTAIYGTRGANGVVLITTKQGKKEENMQVSYDMYYGIQNPWHKVDMLNGKEYMELMNDGMNNDGRAPMFPQARIDTIKGNTNWQDEMYYKNAPKQSHSVSISGGSKNSTYSSSLSYLNQDGIVAKGKSNFERVALRFNSIHNIGKLNVGTNLNVVNINKKGVDPNDLFSPYSLIQALNTPPIVPVKFDNGKWATPTDFGVGLQEITNPVAMLSYLNKKEKTNKAIGGVFAEFEVINGLYLKSNFTSEIGYLTKDQYTPKYNLDANHISDVNMISKSFDMNARWNVDNTLRYTKSIQNHNFTALVGITYLKTWYENLAASRSELIFDDFDKAYIDNGRNELFTKPEGGYRESRLASSFGRINYDYNEKYLFEGVIRRDGSSKFGSDYRFGIFPSISAGWVISKENFYPSQNMLNYAKLRFSWGRNGNDQIPDFQYSPIMSSNNIYYFGENQDQYNGIQPTRLPNPKVRWEASEQTNIGVNLGFFKNKLTLNIDYYDKRTKDWLLTPTTSTSLLMGNNPSDQNMGEVANKGIEIELGYKNNINELSYSVSLIAASNKSEVISIEGEKGSFTGGSTLAQGGSLLRAEPGQPLGYFWGYKIAGVFQTKEEIDSYVNSNGKKIQPAAKPGDFKWLDLNGDSAINEQDRTNIGSPYPKVTFGLNLSVEWKGIDFYMFWYSALGQDIYDGTRRYDLGAVNYSQEEYDNRWTGEGSTNKYPRFTLTDGNKNFRLPSEYFVKDADYLRLKNLTIGYTLPKMFTRKVNIDKVRLYISFENRVTFTNYPGLDVEIGGGPLNMGIDKGIYPQSKTTLLGANITF